MQQATTVVSPPQSSGLLTRIRLCLALVIAGLLLSGLASFPLLRESQWLLDQLATTVHFGPETPLYDWTLRVHSALAVTFQRAPFLAYAADRAALTHILFAILFVGPYRDPLRNRWVIDFGLLSCAALVALAFLAGPLRGIPLFWRWIDAAFSLLYALPLLLCRHYLHLLARLDLSAQQQRSRLRKHRRHHRANSIRRVS